MTTGATGTPVMDHRLRRQVFVTGGTGFLGRHLIPELLRRGHRVRALTRPDSRSRLPAGCETIVGDPLQPGPWTSEVAPCDTFIHLVGVSHPNPSKKDQFTHIDLASLRVAAAAAVEAGVGHFIYISVARPAPVMKEYQRVRAEGEAILTRTGIGTTILRPWYILGPGRRWPLVLKPLYWLGERLPSLRDGAVRLGLLTVEQMRDTLVRTVEDPAQGVRVLSVPDIRTGASAEGQLRPPPLSEGEETP